MSGKPATVAFLALAAALAPRPTRAQCPSQSACPSPCSQCRVPPASGTNPPIAQLATLFDRIAAGPAAYGSLGWDFGGRSTFHSGVGWCGGAGRRDEIPVFVPCLLLKALYATESGWRQFCASNLTVVSFDCGYGIAQVTSGMRRGDSSGFDPRRVAAEPAYNVSIGEAILIDKWRAAACVGDNDPRVIEDWYFAVWGYNGFAYSNNPNNPMYRADRAEYRTPGVASAQLRGNYPYQELVFGYAHYPPGAEYYQGTALAYPRRSEICASCGYQSSSISEPPGAHRATCPALSSDAGALDGSVPVPDDASPDATGADGATAVDTAVGDHDAAFDAVTDARVPEGVHGSCECRAASVGGAARRRAPGWAFTLAALLAMRARRRRLSRRR